MARHNKLGKEGEQAACEFLIGRGYTVRETNWRLGHLEIDIVAHEPAANLLHIVEVKTRSGDTDHYDPMESITPKKIRNLVAAANGYIEFHRLAMSVQYDVMIITGNMQDFHIQYIPDAFQPPLRTMR
jgi:putative endonuclease